MYVVKDFLVQLPLRITSKVWVNFHEILGVYLQWEIINDVLEEIFLILCICGAILLCTVLRSDGRSEILTGAKIDSFRLAIWLRSAILIPSPNRSRSEPNIFSFNSLLSFRSPIWTYPFIIIRQMSASQCCQLYW